MSSSFATAVLVAAATMLLLGALPRPQRLALGAGDHQVVSAKQQLDSTLRQRLTVANLDRLVTEPTLAWCGLLLSGAAVGWLLARLGGAVAGLVAAAILPVLLLRLRGDQTERRIEAELPDVLEAVARNLRTGASLVPSLARSVSADGHSAATVLTGDFEQILRANDGGVALGQCFDEWLERRPFSSVRMVVSAIHVGLGTGAELSDPLELAADSLRSQGALRAEVAALAAQAKASVVVIGLAPLAFLGVATASGTSVQMLFGSPLGLMALLCGVVLNAVGVWWMQRVIRRVAP